MIGRTKATFIVASVMLASSLLGVVLMQMGSLWVWDYWQALSLFFAGMTIFLGYYHRRADKSSRNVGGLLHECLHWLGLLLCVFLVTKMVSMGFIGRFEASLMLLILLAFSVFLAGVYVDFALMAVGAIMGMGAVGLAFFSEYLYSFFIPIVIGVIIVGIIHFKLTHPRKSEP